MNCGGSCAIRAGRRALAHRRSPLLVLLLLAACGGGGDESPPPPPPPATPAVVTTTNASKLAANVAGSGQAVGIIAGLSTESGEAVQSRRSGLPSVAQQLSRIMRDTVVRARQGSSARRELGAAILIDEFVPCDAGQGNAQLTGTLNDNGTGTLQVSFNNCLVIRDRDGDVATNDTINLNGPATLRVDAAEVTSFVLPTDFTLIFARLELRGLGLNVDAGGTLRTVMSPGNTETLTADLTSLDVTTSKTTRTETLMIVNVYDSWEMPSNFTSTINGRVVDPDHGYVDISTPTPLFFGTLAQLFPDSGQLLLTGAGNRAIRVTALSATLARLELDLDGNGAVDVSATLKWIELTGPAGADLADSDGDGMHDAWEAANGLNRTDPADAALDTDGDGANNLAEYLGGKNPSDPASVP